MSKSEPILLVTAASGQLGRLVLDALLESVPASRIRAMARKPESLRAFAARGVDVRAGDYDHPDTLVAAFSGAGRLLLISGNEVGKREPQHRNAIAAAKRAGVGFVAYTSILKADTTAMLLAKEHLATEIELRNAGIPFALLRNGWYHENTTAGIPAMLANGASVGASGDGRISAASREEYARAAAAVLTSAGDENGRVYELAGDTSYTKAEFAAEVARQSGKPVVYRNLSAAEYEKALESFGLPPAFLPVFADCDVRTAHGDLFDDSRTLSKLIGRPTQTLDAAVAQALLAAGTAA